MAPSESSSPRFEEALADLEAILRELEEGTISLEESLARYERGVGLLRQCYAQLREAEQRVKLLAGLTESGTADLKPFEHVATIETTKVTVRKSGKAGGPGISG
jgi:exodeoxyribonuclease VII small subunit